MKAVIVNSDMEPVTIVELPPYMIDLLRQNRGDLVLHCIEPMRAYYDPCATPEPIRRRTVYLRPLVRQLTILQTDQEVDALTLQATFLAGQQSAVRDVYDKGRKKGRGEMFGLLGGLIPRPGAEG